MRWYLVHHARRQGWMALAPRLRTRASVQRLRVHPGDLARLAAERGVVRTGVSAAPEYSFDIAEPGILEAYVSARRLPLLRRKYHLEPSTAPNVIFHVVTSPWPFPPERRVAPSLLAALDLLRSSDPRSQRAAAEFLAEHQET
jgi:hypothetical protein